MAWNEPGADDENKDKEPKKDPWSGQQPKSKDANDVFKQLQNKFKEVITKKGNSSSLADKSGYLVGILLVVIALLWGLSGLFVVQAPEKAVVLRFGKYVKTYDAGLHWIPRFIESADVINVQQLHTYTYPADDAALMLTRDKNIVAVAITVQFRVENPKDYLFNVVSPVGSLQQATASALRQVVGSMTLDAMLTNDRELLRSQVKTQLDETLGRYNTGLRVETVLLKTAQSPEAVRDAFDDAVKAAEDEKRYINQAQAYAKKVEPIAQGNAKRMLAAAKAYQEQVVLQAKAQIAPFLAILPEYKKAPEVTRERIYLETVENVLQQSSKVLVDATGSQNLLYLPFDKLISQVAKEQTHKTEAVSSNADSQGVIQPPSGKPISTPESKPDATVTSDGNVPSSYSEGDGYQ